MLISDDLNDDFIDQTVLFTMSTPLVSAGRIPIRLNSVIDYRYSLSRKLYLIDLVR